MGIADAVLMFGIFTGQIVLSTFWSVMAHKWYFATFSPKKSAIIYDVRSGMEKLIEEYGLDKRFDVRFAMGVEECLRNLSMLIGMNTVFLSGIHSHERNIILKYCAENGIMVYIIPRIGNVIMSGARAMHLFHLPILRVGRYQPVPEFRLRLQAKAGLSGYAQIYGKYNAKPYDKLQTDLKYIAKSSIAEDLRILLVTVKTLLIRENGG